MAWNVCIVILLYYVGTVAVSADTTPQLLIANINTVMLMDTDTGSTTIIASTIESAFGIDYNSGYIYWTNDFKGSISRIKYPPTSNETVTVEVVILEDIQEPQGIAIDTINDHIYWTDRGIDKVMRSELDGSKRTTILDTLLSEPIAIVLDTTNRWIYLSDWRISKIEKCKFDGSNRTPIVTEDIRHPNGLALDLNEERIYWVDNYYDHIKSANLDGSDVQLIIQSSTWIQYPLDIDVNSGDIYYSDVTLRGIYKVSKENGSTPVRLSTEDLLPFGLKIYNPNDISSSQSGDEGDSSTTTTGYVPEFFSTTEVTSTSTTISTESPPSTSFPSSNPTSTSLPSTGFTASTSTATNVDGSEIHITPASGHFMG